MLNFKPLLITHHHLPLGISALLLSLTLACTPSPQDLYEQARQASEEKRFDEAIKLYTEMAQDPQATAEILYQARFGTSEVYLAQGALEAQAKALEDLIEMPAMTKYLDTLRIKLEENYLHRAEVLGVGDSKQLTDLLQKALKLNPKSVARRHLAEHFVARGVIELKESRYIEAEGMFSQAQALKSIDEVLNKKINQYLTESKFKHYSKNAARLVEAKQEDLARRGIYELTTQTFTLRVEVMAEGKAPSKDQEAYLQAAVVLATPVMSAKIADLIKEIFDAPSEGSTHPELITSESWTLASTSLAKRAKRIKRDKKQVYVTPFNYEVKLSLDQLLRLAHEAHEATTSSSNQEKTTAQ